MIATPRVPPSSRAVSLTAEPTPALAGGSAPMIASVAGALTNPKPPPIRNICPTTSQYDEVSVSTGRPGEAESHREQPGGDDRLRAEPFRQLGAEWRCHAGEQGERHGAHTGLERAVAADELEVLGDHEDEAEQREEGERHRDAARGEAHVGEHRDVEHRVVTASLPTDERGQQRGRKDEGRRCSSAMSSRASVPR